MRHAAILGFISVVVIVAMTLMTSKPKDEPVVVEPAPEPGIQGPLADSMNKDLTPRKRPEPAIQGPLADFMNKDLTPHKRLAFKPNYPKLETPEQVEAVRTRLADSTEDLGVRLHAAVMLRKAQDEQLVETLLAVAKSPEPPKVRAKMIGVLFDIRNETTLSEEQAIRGMLRQMISDESGEVRSIALILAAHMKDPQAAAHCAEFLDQPDTAGAAISVCLLLKLKDHIERIRQHLDSADEKTVRIAIATLAQWQDTPSLPKLRELADNSQSANVRSTAENAIKCLAQEPAESQVQQ